MLHVPLVTAGHIEALVHWGDIQDDQLLNVEDLLHRGHHHSPPAHAVAGQADGGEVHVGDQPGQVPGHQLVAHLLGVRGITVITGVHRHNSPSWRKKVLFS